LNVQLLTDHDRVGSHDRTIGWPLAISLGERSKRHAGKIVEQKHNPAGASLLAKNPRTARAASFPPALTIILDRRPELAHTCSVWRFPPVSGQE
jgi:hypothetical protein